jgi:Protein of unknown function (DUF2442)
MKPAKRGRSTSAVEVTNVSSRGFWLLVAEVEHFVAFEQFPWFRDATIGQLTRVELPSPNHLYWPELDVDLAVESLAHSEQFPLVSAAGGTNSKKFQAILAKSRQQIREGKSLSHEAFWKAVTPTKGAKQSRTRRGKLG